MISTRVAANSVESLSRSEALYDSVSIREDVMAAIQLTKELNKKVLIVAAASLCLSLVSSFFNCSIFKAQVRDKALKTHFRLTSFLASNSYRVKKREGVIAMRD